MKFEIGDKVKRKNSHSTKVGTIVEIYTKNEYINTDDGRILFALKGEYKVSFNDERNATEPLSHSQLIRI